MFNFIYFNFYSSNCKIIKILYFCLFQQQKKHISLLFIQNSPKFVQNQLQTNFVIIKLKEIYTLLCAFTFLILQLVSQSLMQGINLALISDFCFPFLGGVEIHILKLAQKIKKKINKVIIITHQYPDYLGIKYVKGIKIYYLKLPYHKDLNIIYATYCFNLFKIKKIFKKEQINLVHVHQSTSCLSLQTMLYSGILGLKVIHTQHSLFTFKAMFDIHMNKFLEIIVVLLNKVICVSRTTRNNFLLRSQIQFDKLIVIPNAAQINFLKIKPFKKYDSSKPINIIFVGRLTYRRGVDLLIDILEHFFERFPFVRLKIVGQGVKMPILKKFIEEKNLSNFVQLLGSVQNEKVIKIMQDCHIYINTPLTESFGIALIQAASEGLLCVSTQVGGIHEVLPKSLLITVKPTKNDFIIGLMQAIQRVKSRKCVQHKQQMKVLQNYNWNDVSQRVLDVYNKVHVNQKAISKKEVIKKVMKKRKILGYFMLLWFLILCIVNYIHDRLIDDKQKYKQKEMFQQNQHNTKKSENKRVKIKQK